MFSSPAVRDVGVQSVNTSRECVPSSRYHQRVVLTASDTAVFGNALYPRILMRRVALSLLVAAFGCSGSTPTELERTLAAVSAAVPDVPNAVAELSGSATLRQVTDNGPYVGFDTNIYPGDAAMQSWKDVAGYDWVGFYLPAP